MVDEGDSLMGYELLNVQRVIVEGEEEEGGAERMSYLDTPCLCHGGVQA